MNNLRISVLVCSKNGAQKLTRMLQSLQKQTLPLEEIILLDDGSEPPLPQVGAGIQQIRKGRSQGLIASRNELARMARGDWMVILDDDVILDDPRLLEKAMSLLNSDPRAGALGFMQRGLNGAWMDLQPTRKNQAGQVPVYYGWAHIIRRAAWLEAGPFAEVFRYGWEETEFCLRLLDRGYKVLCDPTLSVIHDVVDGSKNLGPRHFLNDRNMLMTVLLHHPWRVIPRWFKGAWLHCRPEPSAPEPLGLYRFRLLLAVTLKTPYLLRHREPVSRETFDSFYRLHQN